MMKRQRFRVGESRGEGRGERDEQDVIRKESAKATVKLSMEITPVALNTY